MLRFLVDSDWWKSLFSCAIRFAPRCIFAAGALALGSCLLVGGQYFFYSRIGSLATSGSVSDISVIIAAGIACMLSTIVGLLVSVWATFLWLLRLTAFAAVYSEKGAQATKSDFDEAIRVTRTRVPYLLKFWLVASLYLLLPLLPFCVLVGMGVISRIDWSVAGEQLISFPSWLTPSFTTNLLLFVGTPLMVLCQAYTFVGIIFSAQGEEKPAENATAALKFSFLQAVPVLALTVLVFVVNIVLTTPLSIIAPLLKWPPIEENLALALAFQVWLAVTSTVVWPASVAPFAMLMPRSGGAGTESE
jgi:hypothetical protein